MAAARLRLGALGLLAAAACSPGPGRDPVFPDAGARPEAGPIDAGAPDAAPRDAGPADVPVFLPDAGPSPAFPFTGVFGILNDGAPLFAREVGGRLHVVVGDFPYSYLGTIDPEGQVELGGPPLAASGCPEPGLSGRYSRPDTLYDLVHASCTPRGEPFTAALRGGFEADFDPRVSGEYTVRVEVTSDVTGCVGLGPVSEEARWAISALSDRTLVVFTADDPLAEPAAYFGRAQPDFSAFAASQYLEASTGGPQVSLQGRFVQASVNDPLRVEGTRDVHRRETGCTFSARFEGIRVAAP